MASPVQPEEAAAAIIDIPIDDDVTTAIQDDYALDLSATAAAGLAAAVTWAGSAAALTVAATPTTPATPVIPKEPVEAIGFFEFYLRFADKWDLIFMVVGTVGGIVTGALIPFFQYLFGRILDSLNSGENIVEAVSGVALQFVYMAAVAFVAATLQVFAWGVNGERQTARIRGEYVKALLRQDISWYDTQTRGETATIVSELTASLGDGLGRKNGDVAEYICQFVGGFVIAFMQSWRLTLVLLCAIPAVIAATGVMATMATRAQKKEALAYAAAGSKAHESLAAIRTVQALRLQDKVKAAYDRLLGEAEKMGCEKARQGAMGVGLLSFVIYCTFSLGFFYGARLVAADVGCSMNDSGCMTGGKVLSTFFAVIMGAMGLGSAFPCIASIVQGRSAAATIFHVIERVPAIDAYSKEGRVLAPAEVRGQMQLRDVTFAYPTRPEKQVCKHYNLTIEAGKTVALVGPSGEGKSTIMSLVLRFYSPQEGEVLLDGIPYSEINVKSLRERIGYVGQEPVLFSGTIGSNIKAGKEEATDEEMVAAAKMANGKDNCLLRFSLSFIAPVLLMSIFSSSPDPEGKLAQALTF